MKLPDGLDLGDSLGGLGLSSVYLRDALTVSIPLTRSNRGVKHFQQILHQTEGRKPIINAMSLENLSAPEKCV